MYESILHPNIQRAKSENLADRAAGALGMSAAALRGAGKKRALELVRNRLREVEGLLEFLGRERDDLLSYERALLKSREEAAA